MSGDSHGGGHHGPSPAVYLGLGIGLVIAIAILIATAQGRGPFNDTVMYSRPTPAFVPTARYEHYGGPPAINANVDRVRPGFRVEHY